MEVAFKRCRSLVYIDLSFAETPKVDSMIEIFKECRAMKTLQFPKNLSHDLFFQGMFHFCNNLLIYLH